mgnify:CR=1 FL=1
MEQEARWGSWCTRMQQSRCWGTPELSNIIDEHWFPRDAYNRMIQLEYIAISNQLEEMCRSRNKKAKWQQKGAEIVVLLFLFEKTVFRKPPFISQTFISEAHFPAFPGFVSQTFPRSDSQLFRRSASQKEKAGKRNGEKLGNETGKSWEFDSFLRI